MANPAADPKAAPLADDQKEYLLSLDTKLFPKNFFCSLCNELAFDSYKLLCCNKAICSSCESLLPADQIDVLLTSLHVKQSSNSRRHVLCANTRLSKPTHVPSTKRFAGRCVPGF